MTARDVDEALEMMLAPSRFSPLRVCLVMTCFNRRDKTLACLEAVEASVGLEHVQLDAVLVDDGSSDGTTAAVRKAHPWVSVIQGEGNLYWCRGMHRAFECAMLEGYDHYVWLNDDTFPYPDAIQRLLQCAGQVCAQDSGPVIVVGSTVHPITQQLTYGGERSASPLLRLSTRLVAPGNRPLLLDTLNGNFVLVNAEAAARVGNLDPAFEHAMGDTDYGLRAKRLGVGVWLAPGVHGHCGLNDIGGTFRDTTLPLATRWRQLLSRKGLPWRSWLRLTCRHAGPMWPLYFLWPYVRMLGQAMPGVRAKN